MDLVEVAAKERPPVCKIMDYGKFKYAQSKKSHQKTHQQKLKEIRVRPKTGDHDIDTKIKPGPQVPRAQRQGAGQRAVPRPRDAAHRGRPAGHEPGAGSSAGRLQGGIAGPDGRQADGRAAGPEAREAGSSPAKPASAKPPAPKPAASANGCAVAAKPPAPAAEPAEPPPPA